MLTTIYVSRTFRKIAERVYHKHGNSIGPVTIQGLQEQAAVEIAIGSRKCARLELTLEFERDLARIFAAAF